VFRNGVQASFDVTPDGTRVVTLPSPDREEPTGSLHATFLFNFFDELRGRVPLPRK
jgi:hypothetical protein